QTQDAEDQNERAAVRLHVLAAPPEPPSVFLVVGGRAGPGARDRGRRFRGGLRVGARRKGGAVRRTLDVLAEQFVGHPEGTAARRAVDRAWHEGLASRRHSLGGRLGRGVVGW